MPPEDLIQANVSLSDAASSVLDAMQVAVVDQQTALTNFQLSVMRVRTMTAAELEVLLLCTMNVFDPVVSVGTPEQRISRITNYVGYMKPLSIRAVLANVYVFVRSSYSDAALREAFSYVGLQQDERIRDFFNLVLIPILDDCVAKLDRLIEP